MTENFILYPETLTYLASLHSFPDERLEKFERFALENDCPIVQRDLALFLSFLVTLKQPKRILELGSNVGYSSTIMGLASENVIIDTVEFKKENVEIARKNHKEYGLENRINVHYSDALDYLRECKKKYDFVFIDANKKENKEYIQRVLPLTKKGALICVDNLLWKGRTTAKSLVTEGSLESTVEIRKFNKWIVNHSKMLTQLLPIGDGVSLSIKK